MYIKITNNTVDKYPYTYAELVASSPNTSFPVEMPDSRLADYGIFPVAETQPPTYNKITQVIEEITPVKINGVWTQAWYVRQANQQELVQNKLNLQNEVVFKTQERLDNFAKTRNYDGIMSCCTYSGSSNTKFQTEGQYCMQQRDATWTTLYQIMAEVESGTRPPPQSFSDIESELPVLSWPN